jgi:AhpD family alkylhydroperoxidase
MTQPQHQPRIDENQYYQTAPGATAALLALGKAVDDSGLDKPLTELIKLRASQINGCAYCLQYHLNVARKLGVSSVKLDLVAAWRDAGVFTPRELAALAWTEALTLMAEWSVSDAVYAELQEQFSASEIVFLTTAIANINAWNRIAGALRFTPPV